MKLLIKPVFLDLFVVLRSFLKDRKLFMLICSSNVGIDLESFIEMCMFCNIEILDILS